MSFLIFSACSAGNSYFMFPDINSPVAKTHISLYYRSVYRQKKKNF